MSLIVDIYQSAFSFNV